MKTTHRSIPNDIFSVEEKGRFIRITTSLQRIHVDIGVGDRVRDYDEYTFDQFYTALAAILRPDPPSAPSPDDKRGATALHGGENIQSIDTSGWNWTVVDGAWWVCRKDHELYEDCEFSPATPEEVAAAGKGDPA